LSATAARHAALRVLRAVRGGDFADRAIRREVDRLETRDRAWTRELVLGTLRLRARLDYRLAHFTRRSLDTLDADVLDILRLGVYQLIEMGGVPAYAAISQSVELAKSAGAAAALVNAVLHALQRADGDVSFPSIETDPVAHLSTWGSHPRWLVERWIDRFGVDGARRLVDANNERPPLFLHPVGLDLTDAATRLDAAGVAVTVDARAGALRLDDSGWPGEALAVIPAIVQDPAATAVARFVEPPAAALILDACAAPGGKAIVLAAGTGSARPRRVVASDVSAGRLERLTRNLHRLPPLPVSVVVADARRPPIREADVVLIDAPCTGTGTLRRHADGRWRVRSDDISALALLQADLLDAAYAGVRPGGLLVYATCSLEPEENELQVEAFLNRYPDCTLEPPSAVAAERLDASGCLSLMPHVHGWDGAFAARMRKRGPVAR
jgi:16S rRNA (cytosine967-C5)-methyltransferase